MISLVSGVVAFGAGGAGIWYLKPRSGKMHPLATVPLLDSIIPICIVGLLAVGVALIVSGAMSL